MTMENDSPNWGDVSAGWEIVTLYRVGHGVSWVTDLAGLQPELARLLDTDGAVIWSVEPVGAIRKRVARIQALEAELARTRDAALEDADREAAQAITDVAYEVRGLSGTASSTIFKAQPVISTAIRNLMSPTARSALEEKTDV